ncbi:RWD repeat domain-containing protein [Rutstroemia sp. NJR-2017a WRK4]|nr:RWD repeat domain-containing protein [Rutstroemia sp. NJR-2017a WRK4]
MSDDLLNEIEAINSIYGEGSLTLDGGDIYILHLPDHNTSLRIQFPNDYPATPPAILGTHSSGENARKGEAAHLVDYARDVLGRLYQPGEVCMFDIIEEINATHTTTNESTNDNHTTESEAAAANPTNEEPTIAPQTDEPEWVLSDVVIELKSVFVARSAPVHSPEQAKNYVQHLLSSDKKVRSATHNITAWRIKGDSGVTFQDCDDDGETAAGSRVLHLMQLMDLWNVMVVVTRWYGGHQLGPKRFSIINTVARDAFVKGGFVKEEMPKKKGKRS